MLHKGIVRLSGALLVAFAMGTAASAQVDMMSIPMWNTIGDLNQTTLNQSLFGTDYIPDDAEDVADDATLIELASEPNGPATLAQAYPVDQRAAAEAVFGDLLRTYGRLARQLDVAETDLAGAVAAFLAGSWMAYHDRDVADADFPVLVDQMRQILHQTQGIRDATLTEKQALYEHMAILGTLMAATRLALQQEPDPRTDAAMRSAAGSYLQGFTGLPPEDLVIDAKGLHLR